MGVTYYTYRWYDPLTGRWPSRDPLGDEVFFRSYTENMSNWDYLSLKDESLKMPYSFVDNKPINHFDVLGLAMGPTKSKKCCGGKLVAWEAGVEDCCNGTVKKLVPRHTKMGISFLECLGNFLTGGFTGVGTAFGTGLGMTAGSQPKGPGSMTFGGGQPARYNPGSGGGVGGAAKGGAMALAAASGIGAVYCQMGVCP
jgi:hypothetical protein